MCVLKINYAKTVVFKDFLGLFPDQIRLSHRRPCYQLGYIRKNDLPNEKNINEKQNFTAKGTNSK